MTEPAAGAAPGYLQLGALLKGRYEILDEIGRGGYSVVYAARDRELDTSVAIKLLVPPPADANVARERMRREVQAVRGLSHTHIVAVHDFVEDRPWSFIVMELVDGPDLSVLVRDAGRLDANEVARIGRAIAEALSFAHRHGILHRDIKPQNILIDGDGQLRLTDFGSARIAGQTTVTQTGGLVGTLRYVAPEVMRGERADARSDLYMLGLTLYFALTGRLPKTPSPHLPPTPAAMGYHPGDERPDVPDWLDAVIARATAADPGRRYPTAAALATALADRDPARIEPAARLLRRQSCFICGAPDPLGLGVCLKCGGTSPAVADTLIFIRQGLSRGERAHARDRLTVMLAGEARRDDVYLAAEGCRALVRVPAAGAESVTGQLAQRGIPARAARANRAWAPVPLRLYTFLGVAAGIGTIAGIIAVPALVTVSPIVAVLLLALAQVRLRRPLVETRGRGIGLPGRLEKRAVETLHQLREGTARGLLSDIVTLTAGLHATLGRMGNPADVRGSTGALRRARRDLAGGALQLRAGA
jgi:predicted Ser/Thr protein kinase